MPRQGVLIVALVAVAAMVTGYGLLRGGSGYEVRLVMPSAAQLVTGSPVWIGGHEAGEVEQLEARDGKAVVTVGLSGEYSPLHEGTTSRVEWKSVLGERVVTLYPGPAKHAVIPHGGMFEGESLQIELDQVLATLDENTRNRMTSLLQRLNSTTSGREDDIRATLRSAGPAFEALGQVLEAVGRDGPALRALVDQTHEMTATLSGREDQVRGVVRDLTELTGTVADQESQLREGLGELPAALEEARTTLDQVPAATDATGPLLEDLQPATAQLPSVAGNLESVLTDLRPTVAQLRPTLTAMETLLGETPALLDTAHGVVPPATRAIQNLTPAIAFLRPYTPEIVAFPHGYGQSLAGYDSQGHVWRILVTAGPSAHGDSMGTVPPLKKVSEPRPGEAVNQPWQDAYGSGIR